MSEKVKVTQDQFEWLEKYKSRDAIDYAINAQPHRKRPDSPVVDWMPSKIARALFNGYEVEPEIFYGINEWILYRDEIYQIYQIPIIGKVHIVNSDGSTVAYVPVQELHHATGEEIKAEKALRMWRSIGRVTGQFKWNDVLILKNGTVHRILSDRCELHAIRYIESGEVAKFYPAESCISVEDEQ